MYVAQVSFPDPFPARGLGAGNEINDAQANDYILPVMC